jgi:hypothetical protein
MIGYNVTEMIAETVTARKLETTYHEVLNAIHPHPTISESIKDAIEVAYGEATIFNFNNEITNEKDYRKRSSFYILIVMEINPWAY